jgi:DNA-binding transcriptional MerR regulator
MKCIKCIKVAKGYQLDEIRRIADIDADEKVKGGYWKFVPKSEWKLATRKMKVNQVVNEQPEVELSIEEKKLKRKKNDKK